MQADADRRLAQRLDRLIELNTASFDLDAAGAEKVDDVLGRHRTEELAFLGRLTSHLEHEPFDPRAQCLSIVLDAFGLGVLLGLDLSEVLEIAGGGREGQLLGNEVVPRVPIGDVADLAPTPNLGDVVEKNDLHRAASPSPRTASTTPCVTV